MSLVDCPECGKEISDKAASCPHCGMSIAKNSSQPIQKKKMGCLQRLLLGFALFVALGFILANVLGPRTKQNTTVGSEGAAKEEPQRKPYELVKITKNSLDPSALDSILVITVEITNYNKYPVKDVTIKCVHKAKSGTEIDSNTRTIYDTFYPKEPKVIDKFNMGFIHSQVATTICEVTGAVQAR